MNSWKAGDLALVSAPQAFLYDRPEDVPYPQTDEVLSGWAVSVTGEESEGWLPVRTHYGYTGWIRADHLRRTGRAELGKRPETLRRVAAGWMDLYSEPSVKGRLMRTLPRGSFVEITGEEQEGWTAVRDAGGVDGWVYRKALASRQDDDAFLLAENPGSGWFPERAKEYLEKADEKDLRERIAQTALSFLRAPYRWGGKTPGGIDCSGLAFMSYMENGILIYRDAHIRPDFPVREIPREQLNKGDLIFFPGHVAVCIGGGSYVHATAWRETPFTTVNSLDPLDPLYRQDLAEKIEACGSIFP